MDSNRIVAIIVVAILAVAGVGAFLMIQGGGNKYDLRVAYLNKSGYETQAIANEKGFFGEAGVSIDNIVVSGSGYDSVNALLSGNADIAFTGQGPVASAMNKHGDKIVVLCSVNCTTGGQVWVSSAALANHFVVYDKAVGNQNAVKESWTAAAAATGDEYIKVGLQTGSTTEMDFKNWLKMMGISYADFGEDRTDQTVKLVNIKANLLISAMDAGNIDVLAASQPFPSNALDKFKGSKAIGSNEDTGTYGVSCYITTKDVYEGKKDLMKKFLKGVKLASDYMSKEENRAECVEICAERFNTNKKTEEVVWDTADFKVSWSELAANALHETCVNKGFTDITLQQCKDVCPGEMKSYFAELYA